MNGFLLINKDSDWTSRDVCNKVQSIFDLPKVGHTGTLDPFATGLLIVTIGKATKAGSYIENYEKEYIAELVLGNKTSTGDLTGEVVETKQIPNLDINQIKDVFNSLIGELEQVPPMTSAVHYNGRKLYEFAREGIEVNRTARKVNILSLELLSFKENIITFKCKVSKGTYIRTLGETIAEKLGCVGYLKSLNRISIGSFKIEQSHHLNELKKDYLISISDGLDQIKHVICDDKTVIDVKNGLLLEFPNENDEIILICDKNNNAISLFQKQDNGKYKCLRGLF